MSRALTTALAAGLAASCASAPPAPPETTEPRLVEPGGHRPPPDLAELPQDVKHMGSMIPRWTVDGGPWATLGADAVYQVRPRQGTLRALDLMRGQTRWTVPMPGVGDPTRPPVFAGGRVVVPTEFGLRALTPDGEIAWQWTGAVKDVRGDDAHLFLLGAPEGDRLQLHQLDPATGEPLWSKPCAATCTIADHDADALLVRTGARRLVRFDGARLTVTATAAAGVLAAGGVVGLGPKDIHGVGPGGVVRFRRPLPAAGLARLGRAAGYALLSASGQLRGLDPRTGADRWSIRLDPAIADGLRPERARHFPEGEFLVPTTERFGMAAIYLLVRDDGTLRGVRYGHAGFARLEQRGALGLYATRDGLVLSGTRRRGPPVRHYETLAQDVTDTLQRLARDPWASPEDEREVQRARTWLQRLGRGAYRTRWLAALSTTAPERLGGLVSLFAAEGETRAEDTGALAHTLRALAVSPTGPGVAAARRLGLAALGGAPWPDDLYPALVHAAPDWLADVPRAELGVPLAGGAPSTAAHTAAAIAAIAREAAARGDGVALQSRLQEVLRAAARTTVCPWPEGISRGPRAVAPRCPLTAPPPTATFEGAFAVWSADWAGRSQDLWRMRRTEGGWTPPAFVGDLGEAASVEAATSASIGDRDRDGWDDRLEGRLRLDPRRADADRDGLPDPVDPSPACPDRPAADAAEALRRALAAERFGLRFGHRAVRDASKVCLPIAVASGPVVRPAADALPRAPWFAVDTLPTDRVEGLVTGRGLDFAAGEWLAFQVRGPEGSEVALYRRVGDAWHRLPAVAPGVPARAALDATAPGR